MKSISLNEALDIQNQESLIFQYSIIEEFETSTYQKKTDAHLNLNIDELKIHPNSSYLSEGVGNLLEDKDGNVVYDENSEIFEDQSFELVTKFRYRCSGFLKKLQEEHKEKITEYDEDEDETQIFDLFEIEPVHSAFEELANTLDLPLEILKEEAVIIDGYGGLNSINTNTLLWYSFNNLVSTYHYSFEIFTEGKNPTANPADNPTDESESPKLEETKFNKTYKEYSEMPLEELEKLEWDNTKFEKSYADFLIMPLEELRKLYSELCSHDDWRKALLDRRGVIRMDRHRGSWKSISPEYGLLFKALREKEEYERKKNQPNFLQILVFLFEEIIDFFRNLFKR
ncbi:MAG: hypothetical protein VXY91_02815 [Bacteroidota bacterium]|nr:hypothetical protein [Bacteroidota bacterium]